MFGKIVYISDSVAHIKVDNADLLATNLMNLHIVFEDNEREILGEVEDISEDLLKVHFLGEIVNKVFVPGVIRKPSLKAKIRVLSDQEASILVGNDTSDGMLLGYSPLYNDPIYADINDLWSNHMAVFGNTGSGKSWGVARLLQNVFEKTKIVPFRSNFFIFDAYGEYHNSFRSLANINPNFNFKYYTTNINDTEGIPLRLPIWLLDVDDLALLFGATEHGQLPIIERMMKLARIFAEPDEKSEQYKNHLIAKAIMMILYTNQSSAAKRNDIFSILATCSTKEFNLESPVQGVGYVRKFRECFIIDKDGEFTESILITNYISGFIKDELDKYEAANTNYFTLEDLEKALNFTLISEGLLRNEQSYGQAITLKVRLHSLLISDESRFFAYPNYVTLDQYIASLVTASNGRKAQIINFNLEDIDDSLSKAIVKVYTKMLFSFTKRLKVRASIPFHIFLEEAHRYVQDDNDRFLLGYNIFDRVAKEGRKYGLIFNLISQRPVEMSETVISQCSNFFIFKMTHPRDLEYIRKMLPNISAEIVEKQKTLQPGTCVAFGKAFKVPLIITMEQPIPAPESSNCNVYEQWK